MYAFGWVGITEMAVNAAIANGDARIIAAQSKVKFTINYNSPQFCISKTFDYEKDIYGIIILTSNITENIGFYLIPACGIVMPAITQYNNYQPVIQGGVSLGGDIGSGVSTYLGIYDNKMVLAHSYNPPSSYTGYIDIPSLILLFKPSILS